MYKNRYTTAEATRGNPLTVNFIQLRNLVMALPDFDDHLTGWRKGPVCDQACVEEAADAVLRS